MTPTFEETPLSARTFWAALISIALLAAGTRFYHLGYESLWLDEAITFARSRLELSELARNAIHRFHNPTYFGIVHFVMTFGDSEFVLRLPSAIAGILKIVVVCGLGVVIGGRRLGLLSATLVLLMQTQLKYDQEARMYGLLGLTDSVALASVFWLLCRQAVAGSVLFRNGVDTSMRRRNVWLAWGLYSSSAVFSLYLHNTSTFFVATCALVLLFGIHGACHRVRWVATWALVHGLIGLLFLPWLPTFFEQSKQMQQKGWWAVEPDSEVVINKLTALYGFGNHSPWLMLPLIGFALLGVYQFRRRRTIATALIVLAVGGPVALALVTLVQPMFELRLMLWSAIPFAVLVATGMLATIPPKHALATFGIVTCFGLLNLHWNYYENRQKPNWQAAIETLAKQSLQNDVILAIGGSEARSVYYYLNRECRQLPKLSIAFDIRKMAIDLGPFVKPGATAIWTIRNRKRPETNRIEAQLNRIAKNVQSRQFGPDLWVERYELHPASLVAR